MFLPSSNDSDISVELNHQIVLQQPDDDLGDPGLVQGRHDNLAIGFLKQKLKIFMGSSTSGKPTSKSASERQLQLVKSSSLSDVASMAGFKDQQGGFKHLIISKLDPHILLLVP